MPTDKTQVLLLSTFHMGETNDQHQLKLDLSSPKRKEELRQINRSLASFQPTHICVEVSAHNQKALEDDYAKYRKARNTYRPAFDGEISLLAYEIGRHCDLSTLYGINALLEYDYAAITKLAESLRMYRFQSDLDGSITELLTTSHSIAQHGTLAELLQYYNSPLMMDTLININADLLTYVNRPDTYEGADTAAAYYQRNLRIFANLHRLDLQPTDRALIIMGGSHIAFLRQFIRRSHRYEEIPVLPFLKEIFKKN